MRLRTRSELATFGEPSGFSGNHLLGYIAIIYSGMHKPHDCSIHNLVVFLGEYHHLGHTPFETKPMSGSFLAKGNDRTP